MKRRSVALAAAILIPCGAPAFAGAPLSALIAADATFAKIDDYSTTVDVHELAGTRVEDRTYHIIFKKPSMERVDVIAGPGKGSGVVWLGGDKVKGHRGGILGGIRLTYDLRNNQVTTLRGNTVDTTTIPAMLNVFKVVKGEVSEAAGPQIDGAETVAVKIDVADPVAYNGVTSETLYLSKATHLPVRRERFVGATLVQSEQVTEMKTNVGLTTNDFPW